jgi:hypothetical protein
VPATVRHRGSAGRHKEREQTKTISTCRLISQILICFKKAIFFFARNGKGKRLFFAICKLT